ncbi:putative membrane protein [Yersinia enterocolitica]|nr:putative membrane protein [Yersinia enterocolitica]CNG17783.1 Uncharacterised protein [Yersinia enterocolitica]CRY02848.1 Uncharacterised protein [Yersinia enterocolitica]
MFKAQVVLLNAVLNRLQVALLSAAIVAGFIFD